MKDLRQIQLEFAEYLKGYDMSAITADIIGDEKADTTERLDFYHDAYHLRLIDVLAIDYPAIRHLLGATSFTKAALAYIKNYPSTYKSIRWFGIRLPEFFSNTEGIFNFDLKLQEMAHFEKFKNDCFDEKDVSLVTVDDLAVIEPQHWENLLFELIPACRRCQFKYNTPQVWNELQILEKQDEAVTSIAWKKYDSEIPWLLWRSEYSSNWRSLEADEAWAIDQLARGKSFGAVCEGLTYWIDEEHIPLRAVSIVKTLIKNGVIHRLLSL